MKAVITCGGLGTRLLPFTKELPKEMTPVFYKNNNQIQMTPLIQLIFESLYDNNFREFCFVTGKTKRTIENHFTPDTSNNSDVFSSKLYNSKIFWTTQRAPAGFGDAVKYSEAFVNSDDFVLQAGDVLIIQKKNNVIKQILNLSETQKYDAVLCVRKVSDPKRHGIVEMDANVSEGLVHRVDEKPENPKTNLGIMPLYLFNKSIFSALNEISLGKNNEIQVTDAIQKLIDDGKKVFALRVDDEMFWDVGTPESYWDALNQSYNYCQGKL